MNKNNLLKNPWTAEDEGDHYPSMKEWWVVETLFKTLDDNKKWNFKGSMAYERETPSCFIINLLFDIDSNKCIVHRTINDDINKFTHKKNIVDLKYEAFTIKGIYPNYNLHYEDKNSDFLIDMDIKAKIPPHWSTQDLTNGYLPFGLDYYRYGWLLNSDVTGKIKLNDKIQEIKGKAYLEHAWGNFSYSNPFKRSSKIKKTISIYARLIYWWFKNNKPGIPDRIAFTTENNPFGYDWFWGVFENNWSIFYGNSLFWLSEGPSLGVLTLFDENGNYLEFSNIKFRYNKVVYIKDYDVYYPSDISVTAKLDDKKIELRSWAVCDSFEYIDDFPGNGFYKAFILCEMPGKMKGVYSDNEKTIELTGDCKHAPQRQPSKLGHNSLKIDFIKPPQGVGLSLDFDSHFLKKQMYAKLQLAPKFKMDYHF
ncbi:MAG: hypothetical protein QHH15_01180 [Candidatus Thermoplasmatota archaeon]|jgi:hypothetical protein|nr:hypothetical protein [Candidatus Thermoplasmatota archaeon]